MDVRRVGKAGLVGWRVAFADRLARRIEPHTRFDLPTIKDAMGLLFIGIACWYLISVATRLARE